MISLIQPVNSVSVCQFVLGLLLSLAISVFSFKMKFLTMSGSMGTFVLAFLIYGFGGWQWTLPILSFFVSSSLLSKVREKKNPLVSNYFEKSGSRDFYQVFANGGPGGILVVINHFYPGIICYIIYSAIIASSCADTWATEIGTMTEHKTYNTLKFIPVEQGSSGGVSSAGFTGSLLGALFISLISVSWIENNRLDFILLIVAAGFAASIIDSILGASIQIQYKCKVCKRIVDKKIHCETETEWYKGIKFINNDLVNLAAGLSGGIIALSLNGL